MYLHFATVIGDYERVVEHYILEEEWIKAIDVINRQVSYIASFMAVYSQYTCRRILRCTIVSDLYSCDSHRKRRSTRGFGNHH
jgi:hypothetical protein